mmetsp:Transcript_16184/g.40062  ORF Transcript_16184/g.40062 Transcript_16184/m.40062 type:complete len:207 (-) Transcript_16184:211-831(-)
MPVEVVARARRAEGHVVHDVHVVPDDARLSDDDPRRVIDSDPVAQLRAWMDVDAEHVRPLALQQPRDELACIASPPPVVTSHTRARERLDALVEEVDAEHVRAGGVHLLEAEQVGGDARAQAGLGAEGGEEDLLVVDPAADPPVGGELATHAKSEATREAHVIEHLAREKVVDTKLVKVERPPRLLARLRDCVRADLRPDRTLDAL